MATNRRLLHKKPQCQNHPPTQISASRASSCPIQENSSTKLIQEPKTKPISQDDLVAEVKGIYAGLVMVENKGIEVDDAQNTQSHGVDKLNNEQRQALIALHRTLLHDSSRLRALSGAEAVTIRSSPSSTR
ncbi:hypothetical protein B0T25DRAFT_540468 [Lasiosphaeria hispida]|uniref:Uncharacterized protein n=1 Tax=Lasiosphaeria hispida TaxID=260671 RepID=A0AAJ0MGK4_9PEZI|nr:hypothetical protein B0T25DRAFT_540468 [Lasiosphaeria hispida]